MGGGIAELLELVPERFEETGEFIGQVRQGEKGGELPFSLEQSGTLNQRSRVQGDGLEQVKIHLAKQTTIDVIEELDDADDRVTGLQGNAQD